MDSPPHLHTWVHRPSGGAVPPVPRHSVPWVIPQAPPNTPCACQVPLCCHHPPTAPLDPPSFSSRQGFPSSPTPGLQMPQRPLPLWTPDTSSALPAWLPWLLPAAMRHQCPVPRHVRIPDGCSQPIAHCTGLHGPSALPQGPRGWAGASGVPWCWQAGGLGLGTLHGRCGVGRAEPASGCSAPPGRVLQGAATPAHTHRRPGRTLPWAGRSRTQPPQQQTKPAHHT